MFPSEILASNNIDINVNSSAILDHNFLPNTSTISGDVPPDASSTLDRDDDFPSSGSNQNIVTSILTELPQTFQPSRKLPSELNCGLHCFTNSDYICTIRFITGYYVQICSEKFS